MNQKISYYYKYNFVSPEPIYAQVKEELKSYFQTGVIDDILFPRYTEDCLNKLGRSSYKIEENMFQVEDYEVKVPDNFHAVRELWLTTPFEMTYKMPNSHYEQSTIRVSPIREDCNPGSSCAPNQIKVTYKINGSILQTFHVHHLLKPGNVHAKDNCSLDSMNRFSDAFESFDVRNGKIVTNFPSGTLYMVYYVKDYDQNDYQLVPDNQRIRDYIYYELYYRCFVNIYNTLSDESLPQIERKMQYFERKRDEAKVMADIEVKKQTVQQQVTSALSARRRLQKYNIT